MQSQQPRCQQVDFAYKMAVGTALNALGMRGNDWQAGMAFPMENFGAVSRQ